MSWTKVALTATCDLADPGWTSGEAPEAACDLTGTETLVFNEMNHVLATGYVASLSGWRHVLMESVCDE